MALQKLDLDTVLKSESNKQKSGNAKHIDTAVKSVEEKFSKEVSKIGAVDGELWVVLRVSVKQVSLQTKFSKMVSVKSLTQFQA